MRGGVLYVAESPSLRDRGRSKELREGAVVVGTGDGAGLRLHDPTVSREHVRLTVQDDGVRVEDLGSTNGTLYLGQRINSVVLQSSARLDVGRVALDVLPLDSPEHVPLSTKHRYCSLLGTSEPMRRLYTLLEMLEDSEAPVLIEGETGTGKELVAWEIHNNSRRADQPFVIIDCANMAKTVIESELFGHKRGAFTGAERDRPGAFRAASGGTIFLDELGELPAELQPKLLRVLETGQVRPVGDDVMTPVDVRVVAATHRSLDAEVSANRFRSDLYYRVAVVRLHLAPLRARRDDIMPLARHLAHELSRGRVDALPDAARDFFLRYDWPGNVRELRNTVHRWLALGNLALVDPTVRPSTRTSSRDPTHVDASGRLLSYRDARDRVIRSFETAYLEDLIAQAGGSISEAARAAGIDRKQLRALLKKHDLYDGPP